MIKVLFVCLGNICRSPMAEGVFRHMVKEAGLSDKIHVESAGTAGYHIGERAHSGTLNILKKYGIPYDERAQQFVSEHGEEFDYILAMDLSNRNNIERRIGMSDNVHMFLSFAYDNGDVDVEEVPDPYYTGNFEYVYRLVEKGSRALLEHIRKEHGI